MAAAWSAHLITASGAVWGLLALLACIQQRWQVAFFWMAVAILVDGVDGTLARLFKVNLVLPGFDGALLDNLVDYLNYVVVPAVFFYETGLLPDGMVLAGTAMICLASAYQFCQVDAKTEDHYFKGFPSYWNVVAAYLFVLELGRWPNLLVLVVLSGLVFVPIKYIYPSRTAPFRRLTLALTAGWGVLMLLLLARIPTPPTWLVWLSLLYVVYYMSLSLFLTLRPAR